MQKNLCSNFLFGTIITFLFLTSSCSRTSPPPTTCSSFSVPDSILVNQSVTFTSCSSGATSYLWDFGDSSSKATTPIATHTYIKPGIYTVTFTPSNSSGPGTPKTFNITVYAGYYTFKGITTMVKSCVISYDVILIIDADGLSLLPNNSGLIQNLPNGTYPDTVGWNETGNNKWNLLIYQNSYEATGGTNQTITVSSTGNSTHGSKTMSGTGINMAKSSNLADSASLNFNLTYSY